MTVTEKLRNHPAMHTEQCEIENLIIGDGHLKSRARRLSGRERHARRRGPQPLNLESVDFVSLPDWEFGTGTLLAVPDIGLNYFLWGRLLHDGRFLYSANVHQFASQGPFVLYV